MKRITLSCLTIVAIVAALGNAGPAGMASAEQMGDSGARAGGAFPQSGKAASVTYHVGDGLYLGSPTETGREGIDSLHPVNDVGDKGAGFTLTFSKWSADHKSFGEVSWPLFDDEGDTGYTVTTRLSFGQKDWGQTCTVTYRSVPVAANLHCSVDRRGLNYDWDMYVTSDEAGRLAQVTGAIKTDDHVSLTEGEYWTDADSHIDGAYAVPAGSSTQFNAFVVEEWGPAPGMEFRYAILDDGKPAYSKDGSQRLYFSGGVRSSDRTCSIVTADDHPVDSQYSCAMSWDYGPGPGTYVHYITVTKNT